MRYGDWVVMASLILNIVSMVAYGWQSHWTYVMYFLGAACINGSLILMWYFK